MNKILINLGKFTRYSQNACKNLGQFLKKKNQLLGWFM